MSYKTLLFLGFLGTTAAAGTGCSGGSSGGAGDGGTPPSGSGGTAGGPAGSGGTAPTGGSVSGGTSGSAGVGGSTPGGSGGAAGSGGNTSTCTITATSQISSAIATVGIVTFTTDHPNVSSARIDFGLDTNYGMTAPVDLAEPSYRTLLLGMKQMRPYHFRIVVGNGTSECFGSDQTIMTGQLPNILPTLEVDTINRAALAGGFVETGQYQAQGGTTSPAYILDADGDFVWAVRVGNYVTAARQSWDGKYMWINGTDNMNTGMTPANIHRVSMDGLVDEDLSDEFGIQDHQMTILPDESVIFYGHDQECPDIKRRYPDGRVEVLVNARTAQGSTGPCHVNYITHSPDDDTLVFSDDNHDNYTKITMTGQVIWVLGGATNDFTGDGASWVRQHGIHILSPNRFVYFNNGPMSGGGMGSQVHELTLDLNAMTATRVWTYTAMPRISNIQLGDVQRMSNGNTVVAFSTQGVLQEVDAQGTLLQEIVWPLGGAFGYIHKRASLYGRPPR